MVKKILLILLLIQNCTSFSGFQESDKNNLSKFGLRVYNPKRALQYSLHFQSLFNKRDFISPVAKIVVLTITAYALYNKINTIARIFGIELGAPPANVAPVLQQRELSVKDAERFAHDDINKPLIDELVRLKKSNISPEARLAYIISPATFMVQATKAQQEAPAQKTFFQELRSWTKNNALWAGNTLKAGICFMVAANIESLLVDSAKNVLTNNRFINNMKNGFQDSASGKYDFPWLFAKHIDWSVNLSNIEAVCERYMALTEYVDGQDGMNQVILHNIAKQRSLTKDFEIEALSKTDEYKAECELNFNKTIGFKSSEYCNDLNMFHNELVINMEKIIGFINSISKRSSKNQSKYSKKIEHEAKFTIKIIKEYLEEFSQATSELLQNNCRSLNRASSSHKKLTSSLNSIIKRIDNLNKILNLCKTDNSVFELVNKGLKEVNSALTI